MTDQEIRVAIAESLGWKECGLPGLAKEGFMRHPSHPGLTCLPPDYPNSLDAMHEAEAVLNENQQYQYCENIAGISAKNYHRFLFRLTNATARQRAEAFLRTVGKWKDSV